MKSIIHDKNMRTCYLCMTLHNDITSKYALEAHHIFGGNPNRKHSEKYGLKVYLCPEHHRTGPEAVHREDLNNNKRMLQDIGQQAFERAHPELSFISIFGRNYKL